MRRLSLLTAWACCAILLAVRCTAPPRQVLTWDVFGYYLYLPATVIHHDTGLRDPAWLDAVMTTYEPSATLYQLVDGTEGRRVIKYSAGMAVLYAPFFVITHAAAPMLGYPADGFSPPYQWTIAFGCLLYAMLGLFVLRKVLLHFFSDRWTAVLLALVVLGTNFLQLTALDGTMLTHTPLFTLYALLLWGTLRWHERPHARTALLIGASAGLITLVRPSEGACLLIPLLWLPSGEARWKRKRQLVVTHLGHVLLAAGAFGIAVLPQPLYWHAVTGQWLFYSYVNPGEGFDLATPHTMDFLFSFRKGWLLYTPLMVLALIGIP
ncbi:MAG: glycosyltransferase family 39 protein, partial [Bacteroidetes bacterium]|nr:glycosyltransferase family 39 protein [Bacteroidota bacterium]